MEVNTLRDVIRLSMFFGCGIALPGVMRDDFLFRDLNVTGMPVSGRSCGSAVEDLDIVLINDWILRQAKVWVSGCERCAEYTPITFDYLLDAVTGCDPTKTEYVMCRPLKCPTCAGPIHEKTLVVVA